MTFEEWYKENMHLFVAQLTESDMAKFAWQASREAAIYECAKICKSVNNYDNPMTALDCVDAILELKDK